MTIAIEAVGEAHAILGEGVIWSERDQAAYWVDIRGRRIIRTNIENRTDRSWAVEEIIGCLVEDPGGNGFLAAMQSGFVRLSLPEDGDKAIVEAIWDPEPTIPGNRFNDGALDLDGYFWAGSMDDAERKATGSWWRLKANDRADCLMTGFGVTNGPAFSPDGRHVYLTDSPKQTIYRGRYDNEKGLVETEIWRRFEPDQGYPDGMNFGPDGLLWIAFWDGGCIRALDADGKIARKIELPVPRPTKIAFSPDGRAVLTSAQTHEAELSGRLLLIEGF